MTTTFSGMRLIIQASPMSDFLPAKYGSQISFFTTGMDIHVGSLIDSLYCHIGINFFTRHFIFQAADVNNLDNRWTQQTIQHKQNTGNGPLSHEFL